jgi:hypothetical protein
MGLWIVMIQNVIFVMKWRNNMVEERILHIDSCILCAWNEIKCYHPEIKKPGKPGRAISEEESYGFPTWCPLPKVGE